MMLCLPMINSTYPLVCLSATISSILIYPAHVINMHSNLPKQIIFGSVSAISDGINISLCRPLDPPLQTGYLRLCTLELISSTPPVAVVNDIQPLVVVACALDTRLGTGSALIFRML